MSRNFNQKLITDRSEKSVEHYLNEISKFEPLTREEEKTLALRIQQGDVKAMHRLIEANLKYAVTEAKKYQTGNIPFSELLQQANLGAIEAAKRFDPSKGTKFITYMKKWNQQAILHYISEYGRELRLPANQVALKNKIRKFKQNHLQINGELPDVGTIAIGLDVEYDKVDFLEKSLKSVVSMDNTLSDDTATNVGETIENEDSLNPIEALMDESLSIDMARVISKLSSREREIIKMSFGIGYDEYHIDEIAEIFSLTRERIRQIKDKAFKKIARLIEENNMLENQ
jgi:RNA polymerase primary sigma factor